LLRYLISHKPSHTLYLPFDPNDYDLEYGACEQNILEHKVDETITNIKRQLYNLDQIAHIELCLRSYFIYRKMKHYNIDSIVSILDYITDKICRAIIPYGTMCGTISAQSIGEPATQVCFFFTFFFQYTKTNTV